MENVLITALDQEGRGITRVDGKAVFVEGALIGERVDGDVFRKKPNYEQARMTRLRTRSPERVEPHCPHFGTCGGCSLQHLDASAQVAIKQRVLEDALWHIARIRADRLLAPIHGPTWGYRQRARLSVRHVVKKGGVLVGFHEKKSSFVADMSSCPVLPPHVSDLLLPLRTLIGALSIRDRLPQIELAIGESDSGPVTALVLRVLEHPSDADRRLLIEFADHHGVRIYLQPKGPATVTLLHPQGPALSYALPEFGIDFAFSPTDFTQVNGMMNRALVRRAIGLLEPQPGQRIADFFCGLGNFTLPIARRGASVVGVEGNRFAVDLAKLNAARNGLGDLARFEVGNLFEASEDSVASLGHLDKALLDPPREGAIELVKALPATLSHIVYVSCNPATLARDAAVLVNDRGYVLSAAGVANMFPHTAHVESVALFTRPAPCDQRPP